MVANNKANLAMENLIENKNDGMREPSYWDRFQSLHLYSLERRRDRYFIVYVWKMINDYAPNITANRLYYIFSYTQEAELMRV